MNMKIVPNHQRLKLRIEDFFDSCEERKQAGAFIDALAGQVHTWIFGGMIRDIGLYGRKGFVSDIDLVVDSSQEALLQALQSLSIENLSMNKLGGIRFRYSGIDFDIWCIQDTWAFKNSIVKFEEPHSLLKTTLMSWDSVLYDVKRKHVISTDNYLRDLHLRRLELVLQDTPNQEGSLIRILRTIYKKHVQILGPNICDYLRHSLQSYTFDDLSMYERRRYQSCSFTEVDLLILKENLRHAISGHDTKISL